MSLLKNKLKINKVSLDFSNYYFFLKGVEKSGKTTLARDLVIQLYGKPENGLLFAVGNEKGYKALDNIQALDVEEWSDFSDAIDDLIENREEYKDIKFVFIDTLDELITLAEEETIRQSKIDTGKVCKSLNSAMGGYGAGRKYLCKIVDEKLSALKNAGYGLMILGHTKLKTIKEQGATEDQEYQVLDSNLNADYANIVAHKADVIATINIEREVNEAKRVVDTKRWVYFRNNGFINSGTRFSNIVDKIELSAPNFVKAIEDAIKNSMESKISDTDFTKLKAEEVKENSKKAEAFVNSKKAIDVDKNVKLIAEIKTNIHRLDMAKIKPIMDEFGVTSFNEPESIKTECLERIVALI